MKNELVKRRSAPEHLLLVCSFGSTNRSIGSLDALGGGSDMN